MTRSCAIHIYKVRLSEEITKVLGKLYEVFKSGLILATSKGGKVNFGSQMRWFQPMVHGFKGKNSTAEQLGRERARAACQLANSEIREEPGRLHPAQSSPRTHASSPQNPLPKNTQPWTHGQTAPLMSSFPQGPVTLQKPRPEPGY